MMALVLASLLWGTTGTAATLIPASVSSAAIGAATMGFGGLLLFLVAHRGARAVVRDRGSRRWVVLGAMAVVAYPLAFYPAMAGAGVAAGNAVSLGSAPLFAALLEWLLERRRPSHSWWWATAIAAGGLALLATGGAARSRGEVLGGLALGLLAGLAYATYTYASRRMLERGHPSGWVMGAVFGAGAVPLLVVVGVQAGQVIAEPSSLPVLAYLAVGPMFAAYLLFGRGLRRVSSSTATTVTLLEPVVATLLAVLVVGERLPAPGWLGLVALVAGVLLLVPRAPRSGGVPG